MSKNSTTWAYQARDDAGLSQQFLHIGDGYDLLIEGTYKLEIQAASAGSAYTFTNKNSSSWAFS